MKKKLETPFSTRQYMLSEDFELYYYSDSSLKRVASHAHDYYEFYFFLEGDVSMEIEARSYPLAHGDVILIPPGVSHKLIIHDPAQPYRRFVFWMSREFCRHLLALSADYGYLMQVVRERQDYIFHNDRITFNAIQSRLLRLLEEMRGRRFCRDAQISLCVKDLLLYLTRLIYERNHTRLQPETDSLYESLCAFIEEHIEEKLSLERLSEEFFVSKYHIAHVFKENLGLSVHKYVMKKRLGLCRQAILSDMSVTEAYQAFGFGDYSSFYRAFKREYGISPKEVRDMRFGKG